MKPGDLGVSSLSDVTAQFGESPTIGKRSNENLNELLPASLDEVLFQMSRLRKGIGGSVGAVVLDGYYGISSMTPLPVSTRETLGK